MHYKTAPALVKAPVAVDGLDTESGIFTAIVSVFGNVDSYGDVVVPGAFADSIAEWTKSGNSIPVLWSHRVDDPRFNIGAVVDIAEVSPGDERIPPSAHPWVHDNGGLWVSGRIDTGSDASDVAKSAHRLMRERRVTQFSFAYDIEDSSMSDDGNLLLKRLWLHEVSPVQIGANQLTELGVAKTPADAPVPSYGDSIRRFQVAALIHQFG